MATRAKSKAGNLFAKLEALEPDPKFKEKIYKIVKKEFPEDTVDVSNGYRDNVHVVVVSRKFDACRSERAKQEMLWDVIERSSLTDKEKIKILIFPYSPA